MFEFQWPWVFILLLLPLFIRKWVKPADNSSSQALIIPFLDELESIPTRQSRTTINAICILIIAWSLLIAAAAKPVWTDNRTSQPVSHRNIFVAIDLSGSMARQDFIQEASKKHLPITRLEAAKSVAAEFIERRVGDKVGLILFADHAYLQAPLTRDRQTVKQLLGEAELGLAGNLTALGDAVGLAVKKVQEKADQEHVLVLMTDGAATIGVNIDEAIRFANKVKLKVYTLGIGSSLPDSSNVYPLTELDEPTLKRIAIQTGGQYFKASNVEDLESIYSEIDKLEPVVDNTENWHQQKDLFYIPLSLFGLFIIMLGLVKRQADHG